MRKFFAAIALMALFPSAGFACSLIMSPEFQIDRTQHASTPPPIKVRDVNFVPWLSDAATCDGVGFITIELSGMRRRDIKNYGVFIRAQSGVNDKDLFPRTPLALRRDRNGSIVINWAWTGISPDADGKVRWKLELVPVSRSGALGSPIPICVASDDSCPKLANHRP